MVRHDEAGHDSFTKAPTRFDQALVRAGDGVLGEHHPGNIRVKERLYDNANAGRLDAGR